MKIKEILKGNLQNVIDVLSKQKLVIMVTTIILTLTPVVCYADGGIDIGQNIGQYFLGQLFWIALAVIAFVLLGLYLRKATTALAVSAIIGAIVLAIIKQPQVMADFGTKLLTKILGG